MRKNFLTTAVAGLSLALPASSATILGSVEYPTVEGWNKSNVATGETPDDYETGESLVYDRVLNEDGSVPDDASTYGKIVFTPPEAVSPGVGVSNVPYPDSGTGSPATELQGCIKTSSGAACDGPFQSGKRIKQVITSTDGPMDLVFDLDPDNLDNFSTYQVFGRLINGTDQSFDGFEISLGFGIGSDFRLSTDDTLAFSTAFTAQPSGSGSSNTQFPFGLFGDASTNPNFLLDGFFDDERTGLTVTQTSNAIFTGQIAGYYGNYKNDFGPWLAQQDAPEGLFWDFDNDETTDNLLMAWEKSPGVWELRRQVGETCETNTAGDETCTDGVMLGASEYVVGSRAEIELALQEAFDTLNPDADDGAIVLSDGKIEDFGNLNLNYAIALGDLSNGFLDFNEAPA
ncbi:choice-of-anchor F family protein [Roseobacter ponti]|uniref:Choice-of-anchor F family protein n=1 Tax=Roseobacter ponti TaxID=1891787 RepID=A0A858SS24_9RHOB|nr:choice-of-anchor F family protein [Roseobacter ponti]QJF51120.1 choice-of-anchor F family protein [Roseobacter ponti]